MNVSSRILLLALVASPRSAKAFVPHAAPFMQARPYFASHPTALASIADEVMSEMKTAMKAKDTVTLSTTRLIRASFANAAIELKADKLTDEQAQTVLRKMAKSREDSIEMYASNNAEERADAERAELAVIERWLPTLADEAQTKIWVDEAIAATGATSKKEMGKVMGALMKDHKAEMDGNLAQKLVKETLP
eukprot:CAMPEP_0198282078 /NCGR_PEP_ID=MMETSP1449-20131203/1928_1 /TAXON_ID=420275 /ORGANISM="Attheya septentrionalis, Strain CCMP2084" /LENGTH=191 /DNA_ID=CAMNT_0043978157 /DNA_START=69 /DNA_END=644 /DNA_ORIENTATION=+